MLINHAIRGGSQGVDVVGYDLKVPCVASSARGIKRGMPISLSGGLVKSVGSVWFEAAENTNAYGLGFWHSSNYIYYVGITATSVVVGAASLTNENSLQWDNFLLDTMNLPSDFGSFGAEPVYITGKDDQHIYVVYPYPTRNPMDGSSVASSNMNALVELSYDGSKFTVTQYKAFTLYESGLVGTAVPLTSFGSMQNVISVTSGNKLVFFTNRGSTSNTRDNNLGLYWIV